MKSRNIIIKYKIVSFIPKSDLEYLNMDFQELNAAYMVRII